MEQIKPVNRQKKYISGWIMIINLFWKLRTIRSLNQGLDYFISETNPPHQWKMLDWDLDGKNQACSYGQTGVRISKCIKINRTLYNFRTIKIPMQGSKGKYFSIKYSSTKVQFSSATSVYQIESVVTKKHEIEKRPCIKKKQPLLGKFGLSSFWCKERINSSLGNDLAQVESYLLKTW